ncbi:annexin anxc4 [Trichoderma arundinaceum]|uniref:Annexin anxc4 n=1 Tax=Trichoderma arundinaceum TaxID=490622 RepID=A0A395NIP0_TRIAR|nr:annexin anxc4 [Trichoderma arundinaceum]
MDHPGATISLASITNPRARSRSRDGRFIDEPKQPQRPAYGDSRESSYAYPEDDLDGRYRSGRSSGGHLPYPDDDKLKYLPQKYGRRYEDEDDLAYGQPPPSGSRPSGHHSSKSHDYGSDRRKHSDSDRDDAGRSHRRSNTLTVDLASRDRSRSRSRDGRSGRDRSPQPPTGRMSTLTVNTGGRHTNLSLSSAPASPLLESYHGTYQNCSPMPSPLLLASKDHPRVVDALSPLSDGEGDTRLNRRARFHDAEDIASRLARALKGTHKPDVAPLIEILPSLSHEQVMELRTEYKHIVKTGTERKGVNIAKHIRARLKDEDPLLMKACYAVALGKWEGESYWANFWYQGDKTRRELLIESLMGRTNEEIRRIKDSFSDKKYDNSLTKCMKTELKEDKFKKAVLLVLEERRMEEYDYEGRRLPLDYKLIDQDVDDLHKAVRSDKGGETLMISIVVQRSDGHLRAVLKEYEHQYRSNFARDALKKSNNLVGELLAHILNGVINRPVRDALLLQHAITASRKDPLRRELLISRLVRFHWDSFHMQDVKKAYRERYGQDLQDAVREATSGEWGMFCRELCIARMPNEIRRMENTR